MGFLLLVSVLFRRPLTFIIAVGGEELKWQSAKTQSANELVQISGRMASLGISDVVTSSVYSEKPI